MPRQRISDLAVEITKISSANDCCLIFRFSQILVKSVFPFSHEKLSPSCFCALKAFCEREKKVPRDNEVARMRFPPLPVSEDDVDIRLAWHCSKTELNGMCPFSHFPARMIVDTVERFVTQFFFFSRSTSYHEPFLVHSEKGQRIPMDTRSGSWHFREDLLCLARYGERFYTFAKVLSAKLGFSRWSFSEGGRSVLFRWWFSLQI